MKIRIGSRGSDLALWQAHFVTDQLTALGHEVELKIIETKGDRIQDLSFDKIEGKGFFTKEIEEALLHQEIDLAVHSHKDLETTNPTGLMIAAVSYRENPTDQILIRKASFDPLKPLHVKKNAVIGTSSARRKSQAIRMREDIELKDLRGNVPTRVDKLRQGQYDAIILATAGLKRLELDLSEFEAIELDIRNFVPAPAQGVLALQIRETDTALMEALQSINHPAVANAIKIERDILRLMQGGCQLPLGVFAEHINEEWHIHVSFASDKDEAAHVSVYESPVLEDMAEIIVDDLQHAED